MFTTDLAMEAAENRNIPGVRVSNHTTGKLACSMVEITSRQAGRRLGKPPGRYVTLEWPHQLFLQAHALGRASRTAAEYIRQLLPPNPRKVLVVGLGNRQITADALGPRVVDKILVTRHLQAQHPGLLDDRLAVVSAIAPGVMGETGVETAGVIKGLVPAVQPDVVVCVDALASRRTARIGRTLQICDTGIAPGSGLGTPSTGLNQQTLGVPVVALGVPMVVYAQTIARDAAEALVQASPNGTPGWHRQLPQAVEQTAYSAFGQLVVTPKEIDHLTQQVAQFVSDSLNAALHPGLPLKQLQALVL